MKLAIATLAAILLASLFSARAEDKPADFYRGRQLHLLVGSGPGAGYDLLARLVARYMSQYIPGQPTILVQNQSGAGSLLMSNWLANVAPRDGTYFGASISGMPTAPLLEPESAQFDSTKLSWIGSAARETMVIYTWESAPVQDLKDLSSKELVVGANARGTAFYDFPILGNEILGMKFKIIAGYQGAPQIHRALEAGEVQGVGGGSWSTLKQMNGHWLREGKAKVIGQWGLEKARDLPDVPRVIDLATTDRDRQALSLVLARQDYGRPFFAPPNIPADRLAALRQAFDTTMRDGQFVADALRINVDIDPMTGPALAKRLADLSDTPPDIVARVRALLQTK